MSLKQFKYSTLVSSLIIGFMGGTVAHASSENVKVLEPIHAIKQDNETSANTVSHSKEILEKYAVKNWSDLSKRIDPSLEYNQSKRSLSIRGNTGARIEVTEDGVPLPYVEEFMLDRLVRNGNGGHQAINFDTVSSVDVTKGAGADSRAIAGSVALQSLRPKDLLTDGQSVGLRVKGEYSGYDDSWTSTLSGAVRFNDKFSALASYSYKQGHEVKNMATVGGVGNTRTKVNPEDKSSHQGLLRLEYQLSDAHLIDFGASTFNEKAKVFDLYEVGTVYKEKTSDHDVKRDRVWLRHQYINPEKYSGFDEMSTQLYWQRLTTEAKDTMVLQRNNRTASQGLYLAQEGYGLNFHTAGTLGSADFSSRWSLNTRLTNTEFTQNLLLSTGQVRPLIPSATARDASIVLSNNFSWNHGMVEVIPGIRFDYFKRSPSALSGQTAAKKSSDSAFSPSLELRVRPVDDLTLYARLARGFRAPTVPELYYSYGFPTGPSFSYDMRGNPNLKPERSTSYEIGAQWKSDTLEASLNYFEQKYTNHIAGVARLSADRRTRIVEFLNYEKARVRGVEGSVRWNFQPDWYARAAFTYSEGKNLQTGKALSSSVPFKGIVGLGYDNGIVGVDVGVTMARANSRVDREQYFKQPGYSVVDVSTYWKPSMVKGLKLQLNVMNAFNKKYWNASSQVPFNAAGGVDYYTQRGRHILASVQYQY